MGMRRAALSLARRCRDVGRRRKLHQSSQAISSTQITTLPNKIRIATEATPGHFTSVGLFVDAGARYENQYTSGDRYGLVVGPMWADGARWGGSSTVRCGLTRTDEYMILNDHVRCHQKHICSDML